MADKTYNFTIFLMKDYVDDWSKCVKDRVPIKFIDIKDEYGLDGVIGVAESNTKQPKWKKFLQSFVHEDLEVSDNVSNRAIMLVKVRERIMVLTFGYGRAFLQDENIEKNFGFRAALNLIDVNKIRSINSATIEDMVVRVQKQSSYSTDQDEFSLNTENDIMMSLTGTAQNPEIAITVSGKDSLVVSVLTTPKGLKSILEKYLDAYESVAYKEKGFAWIDNIKEVRDSVLKDELDFLLAEKIETGDYQGIYISPPDTVDWERIKGFLLTGMGKNSNDEEEYSVDINLEEYLKKIRPNSNIYSKLRRDHLNALDGNGNIFSMCSVLAALTAQVEYDNKVYILCDSRWFQIETDFFAMVKAEVSKIPISDLDLPECEKGEDEDQYNKKLDKQFAEFCLMDKKLVAVKGGSKKIEACDIFTKNKQFIHVKNKCRSSLLSHLFAQGRVSAECFISDAQYREQVFNIASEKFSDEVFNYREKPKASEYEVVYVIIDNKIDKIENRLPFFSLVNLMLTVQNLDRMHMRYSIKIVKKQK